MACDRYNQINLQHLTVDSKRRSSNRDRALDRQRPCCPSGSQFPVNLAVLDDVHDEQRANDQEGQAGRRSEDERVNQEIVRLDTRVAIKSLEGQARAEAVLTEGADGRALNSKLARLADHGPVLQALSNETERASRTVAVRPAVGGDAGRRQGDARGGLTRLQRRTVGTAVAGVHCRSQEWQEQACSHAGRHRRA